MFIVRFSSLYEPVVKERPLQTNIILYVKNMFTII